MNTDPSIQFLQDALNQLQSRMANGNPLPNGTSDVNALFNQFVNNGPISAPIAPPMSAPIPPPIPPNTAQNQNEQTVISNRKYSMIIDYWFRTTKPYTINEPSGDHESKSDSAQTPNKEKGISKMIADYCTPIFRVLPIPKEEHGYNALPYDGPTIYSTPEQWNTFINGIIQTGSGYNNKEGVINGLLSPKYPINWDEEFVVIMASHHGSPPQSIDFKADEYEINTDKQNNSLIVTIEIDNGRSDTASCCAMAYYAFGIVVNKLRGFEKIGVKTRHISTSVPQCTSTLPTDDLATINRKVRQHYANLKPDDYVRNVYEGVVYRDINGSPNKAYNDPFGGLM